MGIGGIGVRRSWFGFTGAAGASGPSRASRGLQGPPGREVRASKTVERKLRRAAYCQSLEPWVRLKFHAGWSGWTRPPTMAGGVGGGQAKVGLSRGGF